MTTTKYKCKIDNQWMWGLETACLTIHSPAGGYVRIDKWHMDSFNQPKLNELVWRIAEQGKEIELTADEMKLLTTYPKATVYKKREKPMGLAQRKTVWRKKNPDTGSCGCGGRIIEKDHGKWIGWYCPKCKAGGSKNKRY